MKTAAFTGWHGGTGTDTRALLTGRSARVKYVPLQADMGAWAQTPPFAG